MYQDNIHRVSRQIGDRLYLYPTHLSYPIGHRLARFSGNDMEMIILLDKCTPITKEVSDIMRGV